MVDFATAWEYWDEMPANRESANSLEDATTREARRMGITTTQLRIEMSSLRQLGLSPKQAYLQIQEEYLT